jgi:hypothetical protein
MNSAAFQLSFQDLLQKAFDKFMIRQKNMQLMLVSPGKRL